MKQASLFNGSTRAKYGCPSEKSPPFIPGYRWMKQLLLTVAGTTFFAFLTDAQMVSTWRGPERDGKYIEQNLLKRWPANGPRLLWSYQELGLGFSSPVITNERIYVTGMEGDTAYIYILTEEGKLVKKYPYGKEISDPSRYPGTRSTPVIIDNLMYITTGYGKLICFDLDAGEIKWSKDLFKDFDGSNIRWGFTENLLIDGNVLYVSPGGSTHNVVALNRLNGNLVWSSPGVGGLSAYNSPQLVNHNGRKILVVMMARDIVGLDPANGKLLWSHPYISQRGIHPNTPIYHEGYIFCFSGYGRGGIMLRLNDDGTKVSQVWENITVDPQMGGAILLDGYIYASGHRNRMWFVVDWKTGEIKSESRPIDSGTAIYADGMLYVYTERGELALVEPLPGDIRVVSKTMIELGSYQHWAHLVINNGVLFVRRGNALMAFNVK